MRSSTDYCILTRPTPRTWNGNYHKGHMRCIRAARRIEAEERARPVAEAKAAAAKAVAAAAAKAAPVQATAEPAKKPGNRKRKRRGPERLKASQR